MIDRYHPDPAERDGPTEQDLAIGARRPLRPAPRSRRAAVRPRRARHRCRVRQHGRRQPAAPCSPASRRCVPATTSQP